MTCVVIGAGIAGCSVARMLAERDQTVHLYEQTNGVGGLLREIANITIAVDDQQALSWLMAQVPLMPVSERQMAPRQGSIWLCEKLLAHPRITLIRQCQVRDVLQARRYASHVVSTASPDMLVGMRYGVLPWRDAAPVRHPQSLVQYQQYATLFYQEKIHHCGSLASFQVLSIPQIIRQAMSVTEAITTPALIR